MADPNHTDDELLLDDPVIEDEPEIEDDGGDAHEPDDGDADEIEVPAFGDDDPEPQPGHDSDLVRHLRKELRETKRQAAQARRTPDTEAPIVVGDKPSFEACDFDAERFEQEYEAWQDRGRKAKAQEDARAEQQRRAADDWQKVVDRYNGEKAKLRFPDKDDAEAAARGVLPETTIGLIARVADNPALFLYAAGKNPARLTELAGIDDPVQLIKTVVKMENTLQMRKGPRPPNPDTPVRGKTVAAGGVDKQMEKLEKEADRTGDRTAINAYKKTLKAKAK